MKNVAKRLCGGVLASLLTLVMVLALISSMSVTVKAAGFEEELMERVDSAAGSLKTTVGGATHTLSEFFDIMGYGSINDVIVDYEDMSADSAVFDDSQAPIYTWSIDTNAITVKLGENEEVVSVFILGVGEFTRSSKAPANSSNSSGPGPHRLTTEEIAYIQAVMNMAASTPPQISPKTSPNTGENSSAGVLFAMISVLLLAMGFSIKKRYDF